MRNEVEDEGVALDNTQLDRLMGAAGVGTRVREHLKPPSNNKKERYERYLASVSQQQEQAQTAKAEAKPSLDAIKATMASATPEQLDQLSAFVGELQAQNWEEDLEPEDEEDGDQE